MPKANEPRFKQIRSTMRCNIELIQIGDGPTSVWGLRQTNFSEKLGQPDTSEVQTIILSTEEIKTIGRAVQKGKA